MTTEIKIIKPGTEAKLDHISGRIVALEIAETGTSYKFRYWDGAEPKFIWVAEQELSFHKSKKVNIGFVPTE